MRFDTFSIDALIGAGMPFLIAVLNQCHWNPRIKAVVALLVCIAGTTAVVWWQDRLNWADWRNTAVVVGGFAFGAYRLWWQSSGWAPLIEEATTINPRGPGRNDDTAV